MNPSEQLNQDVAPPAPEGMGDVTVGEAAEAAQNIVADSGKMGNVTESDPNITVEQPAPQPAMVEVPQSVTDKLATDAAAQEEQAAAAADKAAEVRDSISATFPGPAPEASQPAPTPGENVPLTTEQVAQIGDPSKVLGITPEGIAQIGAAREQVAATTEQSPVPLSDEGQIAAIENQVEAEQATAQPAQPETPPLPPAA